MSRGRKQLHPLHLAIEALEDRRLMTDTWGTFPKLVGQDVAATNYPLVTGAGMSIAIIDTGVDYNHPALGGGFGAGHKVVAGYDFADNDADPMDTDGHGTGVAGLAAGLPYFYNNQKYQGVAPGADLIALRIDDGTYGWAKEAPLAEKALQWVIAHRDEYNIVAVNMSFGRGHYQSETTLAPIDDELATLRGMGVVLVSSSGNDGMQNGVAGIEYPGADPNVYSVGSINSSDQISTWTERSSDLDFLAPGENTVLPYYLPATGQHIVLNTGSGTSFATPYAAGLVALLKQVDPTLTPDQIRTIMRDSGSWKFDAATGVSYPRLSVSGAIAMALSQRDDVYENNDTLATAKTMTFSGDTASLSGLKLLLGDADFFKFSLATQADVDFDLTRSGGSGFPTADLFDGNGTFVKHLSSVDGIRLGAGSYYIRVNAQATTLVGSYGITLTQTPDDGLDNHSAQTATPLTLDDGGHGELDGMILLGGSDDYYSFTIDSTHDVEAYFDGSGLSGGSASAQLLDTDGNLIANLVNGELSRRLAAGRYLIKVGSTSSLSGTYAVGVNATPFDIPGENGSSNGIAYGADGTLYLAYYDEFSTHLKFATRGMDGVWSSATVIDGGALSGQFVSLALDGAGLPTVAYYDATNGDLKYARYDGSSWAVQTVDASFTTGYYPALQYTANGRPVISYYAKTSKDLKFANFNGTAWELSTIDSAGDIGRYSSLALNPTTGRWAVAYEDTGHGWFKYAEQTKSGWAISVVDNTTKIAGGYTSLAFNPHNANRPVMSYYDAYNADLKLATYNGSSWVKQVVAGKGSVGLYSNLRIDAASGAMDILYYNRGADGMFRATSATGGGVWGLTQITEDGGRWISRARDGVGGETLAYLKSSGGVEVIDV